MYIRDFQPLPIPQSSVNIDEVKKALSKQRVNRTVEDSRLIEEAYSKSGADKVFVEQQRVLEAKNNLYNQAVYGQQKELVVDKNKIILPGQKGYYELGIDYQKTKTGRFYRDALQKYKDAREQIDKILIDYIGIPNPNFKRESA